jgi:hypothetical protein
VTTTVGTKRAMVATMMPCVGTELAGELTPHTAPSSWPPSIWVAMWLMSGVVSLPNIDRPVIILAVGRMVTYRLHSDFATLADHDVGVGPATRSSAHYLEGVSASF